MWAAELASPEEMMSERSMSVDHSTVHRWAIKLLPVLEKALRSCKRSVGRKAGEWTRVCHEHKRKLVVLY
jgi:transposase-like protein